jgi:hypothetical protein
MPDTEKHNRRNWLLIALLAIVLIVALLTTPFGDGQTRELVLAWVYILLIACYPGICVMIQKRRTSNKKIHLTRNSCTISCRCSLSFCGRRFMMRLLILCFAANVVMAQQPADTTAGDRYFKSDHLTGASYLRLTADGSYEVVLREHMGVFLFDSGRWVDEDGTWRFTPESADKNAFTGRPVSVGKRSFLVWRGDDAPGIEIPEAEVRSDLEKGGGQIPPYVFFEIGRGMFDCEIARTYPFKFHPEMNEPGGCDPSGAAEQEHEADSAQGNQRSSPSAAGHH